MNMRSLELLVPQLVDEVGADVIHVGVEIPRVVALDRPGEKREMFENVKGKGVKPQMTRTRTIARQFTGMGGGDPLTRQTTSNRSVSPVKQLGMSTAWYAWPMSVTGMRGEGRGMQLVRQLTGGASAKFF